MCHSVAGDTDLQSFKPISPEVAEGSSQSYPTASASNSMGVSLAWSSGGLHSSDAQPDLSLSQYDPALLSMQPSSEQGNNDEDQANARDDNGYQYDTLSQSVPSFKLECQLSTYWCTQDNTKKFMWTSSGVEVSLVRD